MPTLAEVKKQIAGIKNKWIFWTEKEINHLPEILTPNERILALTSGFMNGTTWLAVCTNRRVIFLDKGLIFGLKQMQVPLDRIQSIDHQTSLVFGWIRVWDGATAMMVTMVLKTTVEYFVQTVRTAIEAYKAEQLRSNGITQVDVASQLERLAELRTKGIITDEEFQLQKKKILGS